MLSSLIAKRILRTIVTLFIAVTIIFIFTRIIPGDTAEALMGRNISEQGLRMFRERMGLDRPYYIQYLSYMRDLLKGDLGIAYSTGLPVKTMLADALPYSAIFVFLALFIGIVFGISLGVYSAAKRNKPFDYITRILALSGIALPAFVIGVLFILVFSLDLKWFPMVGGGDLKNPISVIYHAILPAMVGGVGLIAYLTRLTRSSMLDNLNQDYVRTAQSKGLPVSKVLYVHTLRNALIPIVSFIGIYSIIMIGDSMSIEIVFSRPGIGRLILGAIDRRDYNLLQSTILIYVLFSITVNTLVDILYMIIDPRIKSGGSQMIRR